MLCAAQRGSSVVMHLPLVLEVPGSIPARGRKISLSEHYLVSFAGVMLDKCIVLSDRDVNWMSPVQGKSPPVQVKEPYGNFNMVTCRLATATRSVQKYTPADNTRKRVWQYIEKERDRKHTL